MRSVSNKIEYGWKEYLNLDDLMILTRMNELRMTMVACGISSMRRSFDLRGEGEEELFLEAVPKKSGHSQMLQPSMRSLLLS